MEMAQSVARESEMIIIDSVQEVTIGKPESPLFPSHTHILSDVGLNTIAYLDTTVSKSTPNIELADWGHNVNCLLKTPSSAWQPSDPLGTWF